MFKKIIVLSVLVLAVLSLGSCRSKKSSCDYGKTNTIKQNQNLPQQNNDIIVACVE